jgi:hypothetical protein
MEAARSLFNSTSLLWSPCITRRFFLFFVTCVSSYNVVASVAATNRRFRYRAFLSWNIPINRTQTIFTNKSQRVLWKDLESFILNAGGISLVLMNHVALSSVVIESHVVWDAWKSPPENFNFRSSGPCFYASKYLSHVYAVATEPDHSSPEVPSYSRHINTLSRCRIAVWVSR